MSYVYEYPRYKITCDVAVVYKDPIKDLCELLIIRRGCSPCYGLYALPGGNLNPNERLDECARRELYEETGVCVGDLTLVDNFDAVNRAPGDRSISCVYLAIVDEKPDVYIGDDAISGKWITYQEIESIDFAFDCKEMAYRAFGKVYEIV